MPNPVVHWEIATKDAKGLSEFYTNVFEWKVDFENPMDYGLVETGGEGGIGGGIFQAEEGAGPFVTLYIQVDDLQAYLDKVETRGGKSVMPPTEIPGVVTLAVFTDPQGNRIGMVKG